MLSSLLLVLLLLVVCTKILDFRGYDSILRGGILMSIGHLPESLSQQLLVGIILAGRLYVPVRARLAEARGLDGLALFTYLLLICSLLLSLLLLVLHSIITLIIVIIIVIMGSYWSCI